MEKRRTLSVRRSKPICGSLAQLLGDLLSEVPPRFSFDWGGMNPPQSKALPPAKRLYAPCGAARRRRAQENAQAWKSAGHSVSGARSRSVVYLPSCLAISPAKFRPARLAGRECRFSFDWGEMNPPQSKVLPPAKRLYAPCGAARRRRAQENAQAWKSAGHSVSGARRQSVVYLPSCLAISSAKFRPTRQAARRGAPIFIRLGRSESAPIRRFCLRQNACTRHAARPAGGGRRRTRRHGKAPDTQCPALEDNLWFTCPAA